MYGKTSERKPGSLTSDSGRLVYREEDSGEFTIAGLGENIGNPLKINVVPGGIVRAYSTLLKFAKQGGNLYVEYSISSRDGKFYRLDSEQGEAIIRVGGELFLKAQSLRDGVNHRWVESDAISVAETILREHSCLGENSLVRELVESTS